MATALTETTERLSGSFPQDKTLWHKEAPRRLTEPWAEGKLERGWRGWQRYLGRRKRPALPQFLTGKEPPILWVWPAAWNRDEIAAALPSGLQSAAEIVLAKRWSDSDRDQAETLSRALQTVALAYALPSLAEELSSDEWWKLAEELHALATEAQQIRVQWEGDPRDVLRQQLLAGELALALGYLFPEVRPLRSLRKAARQALSEALLELTDGKGAPHARLLPVLAPLWACWTRCRWLGQRLKQNSWSRAAETQYLWLVRHTIRLADGGCRLALCESVQDASPVLPRPLLFTALELVGDAGDYAAATAVLPSSVVPDDLDFDDEDLPKPSFNSEWSGLAVMATHWSNNAPRLSLTYADDPLRIELAVGRRTLITGQWITSTMCDGKLIPAVSEWEELLWRSDPDCDYLELSIDLADGLRIDRQLVLGREDRVLYLADMVVTSGESPRQLRHSIQLPLAPDVVWQPEVETRDGTLADSKLRSAVIPPGLFEWRCDSRGGSLTCQDGRLTLTQEVTGRALCCPLFFDFDRRRSKKERTWRHLTVGEALKNVADDVAVGYRVQSGRDQWLFYRSLGPSANRTLLGQNVSSESYAGRFLKTGEVDEWIEVEGTE